MIYRVEFNLSTKLGEALATKILTGALAAAGYNADLAVQPDSAINAINAMLGWIPAVFGLGIIVVVLFLNIESEMQKMQEENSSDH